MSKSVVVTGGFGFVGSALVRLLNSKGITPYIIEKDSVDPKKRNTADLFYHLLDEMTPLSKDDVVVHLAASVDTTEKANAALWTNNVKNSRWLQARTPGRFIYASSGAIYGREEVNFTERVDDIYPVNAYAMTKRMLDVVFEDVPNVYGLRFFNVWGSPKAEAHKGSMKSIVARALDVKDGVFEIFKTGRVDIPDGEQARDFVSVEDVAKVIYHFIETKDDTGGLFNVGTGVATSFNEIADILGLQKKYVEMPPAVKDQYQFFTKADITKLRAHGYAEPFMSVREGIAKMKSRIV